MVIHDMLTNGQTRKVNGIMFKFISNLIKVLNVILQKKLQPLLEEILIFVTEIYLKILKMVMLHLGLYPFKL